MNPNSGADRTRATAPGCPHPPAARGFTLLELVAAISLFAFIVLSVLADREKSLRMSSDARIMQTVRYLAAAKIDEIRHDPERFGERDSGDFEDYQSDDSGSDLYSAFTQDYSAYTWELEIEQWVAAGSSDDAESKYLFSNDQDEPQPTTPSGEPIEPRYVRQLTLTVRFEPDGDVRPQLSIKIVTYLPPAEKEENT